MTIIELLYTIESQYSTKWKTWMAEQMPGDEPEYGTGSRHDGHCFDVTRDDLRLPMKESNLTALDIVADDWYLG